MQQDTPSPTQLARQFLPDYSLSDIATTSLDTLTRQIAYKRKKHPELNTGGLTDAQIAQKVQDVAHGKITATLEGALLLELIIGQDKQTDLLKKINGVVQLIGFLIIASVILTILSALL